MVKDACQAGCSISSRRSGSFRHATWHHIEPQASMLGQSYHGEATAHGSCAASTPLLHVTVNSVSAHDLCAWLWQEQTSWMLKKQWMR